MMAEALALGTAAARLLLYRLRPLLAVLLLSQTSCSALPARNSSPARLLFLLLLLMLHLGRCRACACCCGW